jgi:hypothetical protein
MRKHKLCVVVLVCFMFMCAVAAYAENSYTFWPKEDAWVNQDNPTANYGSATYLSVKDRSSLAEAYLKFSDSDLARLSGIPLLAASLYLYQYQGTYSPADTINMHQVSSPWSQDSVTWNLKPAYESADVSSLDFSDGATEGWREWRGLQQCVASWANGANYNYGLALENNKDLINDELFARFYSSEASANFKPYLKVTAAPEPIGLLLFGTGAAVFGLAARLKKKKNP